MTVMLEIETTTETLNCLLREFSMHLSSLSQIQIMSWLLL